jgi:predicted ATPase
VRTIEGLSIEGYKSLKDPLDLSIRPLTVLAGANSAGKSSALQPLLLLKQTIEAPGDPGDLLLNGPHVRFTRAEQLFARCSATRRSETLNVRVQMSGNYWFRNTYELGRDQKRREYDTGISLRETRVAHERGEIVLNDRTSQDELAKFYAADPSMLVREKIETLSGMTPIIKCMRSGIFFRAYFCIPQREGSDSEARIELGPSFQLSGEGTIQRIIHVPGLRGNPQCSYPTTGVGPNFPGTFEAYPASIIRNWQKHDDSPLPKLTRALEEMGLTSHVETEKIDDTRLSVLVGRLPHATGKKTPDLVNIAHVGFGVSQVLPVLVSLLVAEPGRLVYIEQPELHLHPKAQEVLAKLLADAANRGVRVVIETHSPILLLAIQTLVAVGDIDPEKTQLHWFERSKKDGLTEVHSEQLNRAGQYGDWPVDFGMVSMELDNRYLDAAEAALEEE